MKIPRSTRLSAAIFRGAAIALFLICAGAGSLDAHIVPSENLHPVAESYRRLGFLLRLNPVPWDAAGKDLSTIAAGLGKLDTAAAERFRLAADGLTAGMTPPVDAAEPADAEARRATTARLFELATQAVGRTLNLSLERAYEQLDDHGRALDALEEARQIWAAFEPGVRAADPDSFRLLGECWLELSSAIGHPGLLGVGGIAPDPETFAKDSSELIEYVDVNFGSEFKVASLAGLAGIPASKTATSAAPLLLNRLPPGSDINKQLPRPRQVLNMAARGVDESETTLIALGDMAFDSPLIFGEPARSLGLSCNTCHNKSITNPGFFVPGLSARPGGLDVSSSFFASHANNGVFDPLDIPDLRGIRFTGPYGRNGRFESLREFARNVIVNEFNGDEPDPLLLDGIIAYMLEFDFLPNPDLDPSGRLTGQAGDAARRGEEIFHRPFASMGNRSCATCHVPSDHFLDRKRHDIGSVAGAAPGSRDRALDTPSLLSSLYTAPYFHDGRLPTLRSVNEWFNGKFDLGLDSGELDDLTAYLEAVGGGVEAYEDTIHTLEAEMEEFSFFLSTYEFLRARGKSDLIAKTLATIALEIRAHKWDVQDSSYLPVLDRLAELMDEAHAAQLSGAVAAVDERVAEYRRLYRENVDHLK